MTWSDDDDDLSIGTTISQCDIGETTNHQELEDYIPASLKDFIAEADAALEECMLGGGGHGNGDSLIKSPLAADKTDDTDADVDLHMNNGEHNHYGNNVLYSTEECSTSVSIGSIGSIGTGGTGGNNSSSIGEVVHGHGHDHHHDIDFNPSSSSDFQLNSSIISTINKSITNSIHNSINNNSINSSNHNTPIHNLDFRSPPSEVQGPYDTDMGSECRPNPANLYVTDSAVKRIALNVDPNVCPDHQDACGDCHLSKKGTTVTTTNANMEYENFDRNTPLAMRLDDILATTQYYTPSSEFDPYAPSASKAKASAQVPVSSVMTESPMVNTVQPQVQPPPQVTRSHGNGNGNVNGLSNSNELMMMSPIVSRSVSDPTNDNDDDDDNDMDTSHDMDIHMDIHMNIMNMNTDMPDDNDMNANMNMNMEDDNDTGDNSNNIVDEDIFLPNVENEAPMSSSSSPTQQPQDQQQENQQENQQQTRPTSSTTTTTDLSYEEDSEDQFLPNNNISSSNSRSSFDIIPHADTMKRSNVTKRSTSSSGSVTGSITTVHTNTNTSTSKNTRNNRTSTTRRSSSLSSKTSRSSLPKPRSSTGGTASSKARARAIAIKKQRNVAKPGIMASIEKKQKEASAAAKAKAAKPIRRRRNTVPKAPALRTQKLLGERKYSGAGSVGVSTGVSTSTGTSVRGKKVNGKENKGDDNDSVSVTTALSMTTQKRNKSLNGHGQTSVPSDRLLGRKPKNSNTNTNTNAKIEKKRGDAILMQNAKTNTNTNTNRRTSTVPKGPSLKTQQLYGDRQYSGVGHRDEKKEVDAEAVAPKIDYKNKALTIPKSPTLTMRDKLGDRKYSGVGKREEKMDLMKEEVKPKIDYKKKALTKPMAPTLSMNDKLGDRKYSGVGMREEKMVDVEEPRPKIDYKKKALTKPMAPTLSMNEKLGDRKYSGVGIREEKMVDVEEVKPKIDYKKKALTKPMAPTLSMNDKLGDRKYSGVGIREVKMEEKETVKLDWTNRKVTVAKSPTFGVSARSQREKKKDDVANAEDKQKFTFKALPLNPNILQRRIVTVKRAPTRAPTVPQPFRLQTDERIPEKPKVKREKKVEISPTPFRALPVPDFSRPPSTLHPNKALKKPLTEPKPFHLKTNELASSPRRTRITQASDSIKKTLSSAEKPQRKRIVTTVQPFNLTAVVKVHSPQRERKVTTPKAFTFDRVKSSKPTTEPKPFNLSTTPKRSPHRKVSKDLVHFLSPTKKRKVTLPKPFRLSTGRPSLPSPPVSGKSNASTRTKKVTKPLPSPPPRVKRSVTTLKPFKLSSTNAKIKSPKENEAQTQFRARAKPAGTRKPRSSMQPSVNNSNKAKAEKDDCPINFRRKLLLRSTSSKGKDRNEQTKKVVSQLEELSALVQQTVI